MSARTMAARLLLAAARYLVSDEIEEIEEESDGPLPPGHPVMVRSEEAQRMLREGVEKKTKPAKAIEAPLRGSLAERRARASR